MKKILTIFVLCLFTISSIFAQDSDKKSEKKEKKERKPFYKKQVTKNPSFENRKLTFFINISPTLVRYRANDDVINDGAGRRLRANYGINVEYHLSNKFSVISGLNLAAGGGKIRNFYDLAFDQNGTNTPITLPVASTVKYRTRALQIPAIARWTTTAQGDKQDFKVYGQAGLGFNFGMNAKATLLNKDADIKIRRTDVSEDFAGFDMSLLLGAGVIHDYNEKIDTFLGISIARGFVNQSKNFDLIKNRSFSVDWGIIF